MAGSEMIKPKRGDPKSVGTAGTGASSTATASADPTAGESRAAGRGMIKSTGRPQASAGLAA